jgi:hypothetical protein
MAKDFTRQMIKTIRENVEKTKISKVAPLIIEEKAKEEDNFLTRAKILMEEAEKKNTFNDDKHGKAFRITKNTPQFGDVRTSQEEALLKTIGEQIKLDDDSLIYYPDADDLVFNGAIPSMNTTFQFRLNDPSGRGCYLFCDGLQMTDENSRNIGKILDGFLNWRQTLIQDGDLMDKLKKVVDRNK